MNCHDEFWITSAVLHKGKVSSDLNSADIKLFTDIERRLFYCFS